MFVCRHSHSFYKNNFFVMFLTQKNSDKIVTFFLLLWQVVDL